MSTHPDEQTWRALIAVTTADRPEYLRRCLPEMARACLSDRRLALLVALDGDDEETRAFCAEWDVTLIYCETREGVGLSKNRVLEAFPGYDYYFFVEDDVEVLDGALFARQVQLMNATGIHHMSLFDLAGARDPLGETRVSEEVIAHFRLGGACVNAFTRQGLSVVGGWHPMFATYRRWGHTEHSNRFVLNGLAPAPFNVATGLSDACIWHSPPSVTRWAHTGLVGEDGLAEPERELMRRQLRHVPLTTLAPYHVTGPAPGQLTRLSVALEGHRHYPLLAGRERRHALADYQLWRFQVNRGAPRRIAALLLAALMNPRSLELRHVVKMRLLRVRNITRTSRLRGPHPESPA